MIRAAPKSSGLRVALQMDPPAGFNYATDTSLRLGLEAQARGAELWYYPPQHLTYNDGALTARAQRIKLFDDPDHFYELGEEEWLDLRTLDVILLRQDPPFDMVYLSTTYALEQISHEVLVVNDPASVRDSPEKWFPTLLRQFMPPTLISSDADAVRAFFHKHRDIVLKPLYGYAGHDIAHVRDEAALAHELKLRLEGRKEPLMAQPFLPEVKDGDRRIILIDGEFAGIMARIPAENDFRANFRVGGTAEKATLTPRQKEICDALKPMLKERGLLIAGIDCIGDYLTEINLTSPTGIPAMNRLYNIKLEAQAWDAIAARLRSR